ncbi:antitoxin [Quadrisphaera sp. KR29]|uniref:antitoxin n=1 Tax=Quadrisphaera sp. KR29 TaxID=3461391 RepID=UPI0040442844
MAGPEDLRGGAGQLPGEPADRAGQRVERGDGIDARTGGTYADEVDVAQERADAFLDGQDDATGGEPRR